MSLSLCLCRFNAGLRPCRCSRVGYSRVGVAVSLLVSVLPCLLVSVLPCLCVSVWIRSVSLAGVSSGVTSGVTTSGVSSSVSNSGLDGFAV